MKYETLKAGDTRKQGDEVRSLEEPLNDARSRKQKQSEWHKTELIGLPIMKSDLAHFEYRRATPQT